MRSRKLGDILVTQQVVSPEQLLAAIEQQARMPMVRIGEALLALGFVTDAQLKSALEQQKKDRSVPLGELLVREGTVSREDLQTALARKMGYPIVDVEAFPVAAEAVQRLPLGTARKLNVLPLLMRGERLVVALEDPSAARVIEEVEFVAQVKIVTTLARSGTLAGAIDRVYQRLGYDVWSAAEVAADPSKAIEFEADDANQLLANLEQQQSSNESRQRRRAPGRAVRQLAGALDQLDDRRGAAARRVGHPHRDAARARQAARALSQGRRAQALHGAAAHLPQRDDRAAEDHVRPRHLRAPQAAGRQDQFLALRAGPAAGAAAGDDPHHQRPRRRRAAPAGVGARDARSTRWA